MLVARNHVRCGGAKACRGQVLGQRDNSKATRSAPPPLASQVHLTPPSPRSHAYSTQPPRPTPSPQAPRPARTRCGGAKGKGHPSTLKHTRPSLLPAALAAPAAVSASPLARAGGVFMHPVCRSGRDDPHGGTNAAREGESGRPGVTQLTEQAHSMAKRPSTGSPRRGPHKHTKPPPHKPLLTSSTRPLTHQTPPRGARLWRGKGGGGVARLLLPRARQRTVAPLRVIRRRRPEAHMLRGAPHFARTRARAATARAG